MAVWTLPLAAALTALSPPVMSVLAFGQAADGDGPQLLGAALLGLAVGIPAYGGFLLMTRAAYALGDSRTPALASLGSAILGAAGMVVAGQVADGSTRLALVGGAHSLAYAAGGVWLVLRLHPRVGMVLGMRLLRPLGLAIVLGLAAWAAMEAWSPDGRLAVLVALAVIGAAGAALYVAGLRALGAMPGRADRPPSGGRLMPLWRATAAIVVVAAALAFGAPPAADAAPAPGRLLVLTLPALGWEELYRGDTPALDELLDGSAVGALSVRDVLPVTDAGDGYATLSAGTRASGALAEGQVLEPDEDYFGTPAGAVFERNTGVRMTDGLVAFGSPALVRRNESLDYGAEIGALGDALAAASVPRAAIANADGQGLLEGPEFIRTAAIAMIDHEGTVPAGSGLHRAPGGLARRTLRRPPRRGRRGGRLRRRVGRCGRGAGGGLRPRGGPIGTCGLRPRPPRGGAARGPASHGLAHRAADLRRPGAGLGARRGAVPRRGVGPPDGGGDARAGDRARAAASPGAPVAPGS